MNFVVTSTLSLVQNRTVGHITVVELSAAGKHNRRNHNLTQAAFLLASGNQDRGFAPNRSRRIFPAGKIHSMPSFGGEVK
jgi:hypothetical protein